MEKLISEALKDGKFVLNFQPIFDAENKTFSKAEILLRMLDEDGNIVFPNDFIPIAESNGAIVEIGYYVIKTVCELIMSNNKFKNILFSINVSPVQLVKSDFADTAIKIIGESGVNKKNIIFEFTESIPYEIDGNVKINVEKIHNYGCAISLDDVGKGSSDICKALSLPIQYLKIDKKYIDNIETDDKVVRLIKNIILFSRAQHIKTVAEGVETERQKDILLGLKCEYLQGFYFSKPISKDSFSKFLN